MFLPLAALPPVSDLAIVDSPRDLANAGALLALKTVTLLI
jgi:hypothetical protein